MPIKCPKCGKKFDTLSGFKRHLSATHGGYTDAELQSYLGGSSPSENVQARMDSFADRLDVAGAGGAEPVSGATPAQTQSAPAATPLPTEKRVKATPKKLKKILGGIPAKILESAGIPTDDEDTEALDEASEFLADVFGFEFSVPESKYVVQSRFFAFLWVGGVTLLIYLKHRAPQVWAVLNSDKKKKPDAKPVVN